MRLQNKFRMKLISQNPHDICTLVDDCMHFLRPLSLGQETSEKLGEAERKLREISGSLVITIPKQVCDLYGFRNGDRIKIEPIGANELRLRKIIQDDRDIGELTELSYHLRQTNLKNRVKTVNKNR